MTNYIKTIILPKTILVQGLDIALVTLLLLIPFFEFSKQKVKAATITVRSGYYVGTGVAGNSVNGLGFSADLIIVKSSSAAGTMVYKTSAMPAANTAFTSATADDTTSMITLNSNGFSLSTSANVNSSGVIYYYQAIFGSDCTASGNFCVGTYTGDGLASRTIATNFQPDLAWVKRTTAIAPNFRVVGQTVGHTLFATNTAKNTAGAYINNLVATGFQIGTTNNTNGGVFNYFVFKNTAGIFSSGTFVGNGADNRNITGLGFTPSFVYLKNADSTVVNSRRPVAKFKYSFDDNSSISGSATANLVDAIQSFSSNTFQVGANGSANQSAMNMFWFAIRDNDVQAASGSFGMNTGTFTGNNTSGRAITGVGFQPNLVIVKAATAQQSVFRTSIMPPNQSAYLASATANLTTAITSLNGDGFTLGNSATVNSTGVTYYWQAFGSAYDPADNTGATDFGIGAYYGNGITGTNIGALPWQPDMVAVKGTAAVSAQFRTPANAVSGSSFFSGTADTTNQITAFSTTGFNVGTGTSTNTASSVYYWFGFKNGTQFRAGNYTGNGVVRNIAVSTFRPELVWVKGTSTQGGIFWTVNPGGNSSSYFGASVNTTNRITGVAKNAFTLGASQLESNTNASNYYFMAFDDVDYGSLSIDILDAGNVSVATPSYTLGNGQLNFNCSTVTGTIGTSTQKVRITNGTYNPSWNLSIAPTAGTTANWSNTGATKFYDFNESSGSPVGCADSGDADSTEGQLSLGGANSVITPETGCTTANISQNALTAFNEGTIDSVVSINSTSVSDSDCYFDITAIDVSQLLPAELPADTYSLGLTITVIAN